jgi:hypothetical protein
MLEDRGDPADGRAWANTQRASAPTTWLLMRPIVLPPGPSQVRDH